MLDVKPQTLDTLLTDAQNAYERAKAAGDDKALLAWMRMIQSLLKQQRSPIGKHMC
ncbi:MAG TPA: hypothetical protein VH599_22200 [Ktedonobacterales bacterium]|jgi:hypothetical protein